MYRPEFTAIDDKNYFSVDITELDSEESIKEQIEEVLYEDFTLFIDLPNGINEEITIKQAIELMKIIADKDVNELVVEAAYDNCSTGFDGVISMLENDFWYQTKKTIIVNYLDTLNIRDNYIITHNLDEDGVFDSLMNGASYHVYNDHVFYWR